MKKKALHGFGILLFLGYLGILTYLLFFAESVGRAVAEEYHYNTEPFKEILRFWNYREILGTRSVFLNLAGNVIGFLPMGVLLPLLFPGTRSFFRTVSLTYGVSLLVESTQLLTRLGCFDVDDLILNTLGGVCGYLIWILLTFLLPGGRKKWRKPNLAKQTRYTYDSDRQSGDGLISVILGIISLLGLGLLVNMARLSGGSGGKLVGALGLISMLISIGGFFIALGTFKVKNKKHTFSWIGMLLCLAVTGLWIFILLL